MSYDFQIMLYTTKCDNAGHLYAQLWLLSFDSNQRPKFYFTVANLRGRFRKTATYSTVKISTQAKFVSDRFLEVFQVLNPARGQNVVDGNVTRSMSIKGNIIIVVLCF